METLAINGGKPVLDKPLPETNNIDEHEKSAVLRVLESGVLSDYVGRAGDKALGGTEVLALERAFCEKYKVKHAVSFNSATTALHAAVTSLGIGPGDEVIVSPYTMSASATSVLLAGAVPIFADIEPDTFCLDAQSVERCITKRTKAIMVVNLFGGSARYDELLAVARKHKVSIIEDNAQSPGGTYKGTYLATIGDVGVFSLNFHKVIHSGEGGLLVTNNKEYAFRAQLTRNHGEVIVDDMESDEAVLGSNYRMTEIHAAIAQEQFKKLDKLNMHRIKLANHLTQGLAKIPGITPAHVLPGSVHVYYVYPLKFDEKMLGMPRSLFTRAMAKEGFALNEGYVKPLYLLRIFQNKRIYPHSQWPFISTERKGPDYRKGLCPVTERMYEHELLLTSICRYPLTTKHIDLFVKAVQRVLNHKDELPAP